MACLCKHLTLSLSLSGGVKRARKIERAKASTQLWHSAFCLPEMFEGHMNCELCILRLVVWTYRSAQNSKFLAMEWTGEDT